ncbi:tRNA adenosine deaminase-associated protein [Nocardioides anomalus]|uniref:tRNA adenosine deaminase-associated protein n=1 Tax=Nocardioides anomalus TaxID=2712223 RepID=A0A6G6WIE2_9ACTN|nr:tRNA adenosine deaminase-associated protein [Nocardioides anomalus]QIG44976.1 tRNA adenosine deaminase-associated protein [Nocardioides anomalus]
MAVAEDDIDFAVAAYRDGAGWSVQELVPDHLEDVESIAAALRRLPGDGAVAMVGVDEDFFLIVRTVGPTTRVLLSDASAADDWDLAESALDFLGLTDLEVDDDEAVPAGDLDLLGDLGLSDLDLTELLEDTDAYPDELLSDVAARLGFGEQFDDVVGFTTA